MEPQLIERINALAQKAKTAVLTPAEQQEQQTLRRIYIEAYKASLRGHLDHIRPKKEGKIESE